MDRSTMLVMPETMPLHPGLEALTDGFVMLDAAKRVVYWNDAASQMLGVRRERALGRSLQDVLPPSALPPIEDALARLPAGAEPVEFVLPHLPGCCRGHYSVRAAATGDGISLHLRDATAETKLAERYSQLLESIRDGFVAIDADASISYINGVAERLLALPRERALGTRVWKLVPPDTPEVEACLRATLEDGLPRELKEVETQAAMFRDRAFDLWVHPLTGGGLSVLFQDVTARVRRERELGRYVAEAEEANRAKSRFFAAVSHELRTPLNAIVGYTHLLTTDTYGELTEPALRAASRASVCAEHLAHLVDDLLLMTTAEIDRLPVNAAPLVPAEYLDAVVVPLRQQAESKGLRLVLEVDADAPEIHTDPDRLRQLLHAVLSNAVKFTQRGQVAVWAGAAKPDRAGRGQIREPGLTIRIMDTGPGVPHAARERIFEPFEQLGDPSRSDTFQRGPGLGLTVAKRLAKLLQGDLSLERSDSDGSAFRLDLPVHPH